MGRLYTVVPPKLHSRSCVTLNALTPHLRLAYFTSSKRVALNISFKSLAPTDSSLVKEYIRIPFYGLFSINEFIILN